MNTKEIMYENRKENDKDKEISIEYNYVVNMKCINTYVY